MLSTCGLNPSRSKAPHSCLLICPCCGWTREEEKNSKSKKNCRLREEKGNKTSDAMVITTSHGQTDDQPVLKQKMAHSPLLHLSLFCFGARHMECSISLSSSGCVSGCAPSQPLAHPLVIERGKSEKQRRPEQCANTFQQQLKQGCYRLCFSHKSKAQNPVTCYEVN